MADARSAPGSAPVSNPWVQGSLFLGAPALALGVLLAVLGGPVEHGVSDSSAMVRLGIGVVLGLLGTGLLLAALVIAGVGWYLRDHGASSP